MQSQPIELAPGRVFDRVICDPWTSGRVRVRYVAGDQVFVEELVGGVWESVEEPFALVTFLHCWRADFRPESAGVDTRGAPR